MTALVILYLYFVIAGASGYVPPMALTASDFTCGLAGTVVGLQANRPNDPTLASWPDPAAADKHCEVNISARVNALKEGTKFHLATTHTGVPPTWAGPDPHTSPQLLRGPGAIVAPPTLTLAVSPSTIEFGESVTLGWSTSNATSLSIDNGVGVVGSSGTRDLTPQVTTTYTMTATGPGGTRTASVDVTVTVPPPPPTIDPRIAELEARVAGLATQVMALESSVVGLSAQRDAATAAKQAAEQATALETARIAAIRALIEQALKTAPKNTAKRVIDPLKQALAK